MKNIIFFITLSMLYSCYIPVQEKADLLEKLLKTQPDQFDNIINNDDYGIQIIYTQIDRDSNNIPSFTSFSFNLDSSKYFYPASTVKLPVALLSLEKLNELSIDGLDAKSAMITDSAFSGQTAVIKDTTSSSGLPSIEHYIKKIFIVSDNDAFNRLYEFVGQEEINNKLKQKGYINSNILSRLAIRLSLEENKNTNPIRFYKDDSLVYSQQAAYNSTTIPVKEKILKGKGYIKNGKLIHEPMDFTYKNFFPLHEMHLMLMAVMFPEHVPSQYTFNLTPEDYRMIYQYMSQLPSETEYPSYKTSEYPDSHSKFLMFANSKEPIPENIRIFNKYGQSYGYLIDNAYIIDTQNKVEFLLSAVIQTNENDIYNDDIYEYDEIGYPFMKNLGQLIYNYELKRKRSYSPDLSKYILSYEKNKHISIQ